jgi:hypothetical protein
MSTTLKRYKTLPEIKKFREIESRASLVGRKLQLIGDGCGYLLSKWGDVRHCNTLDSAAGSIEMIGRGAA